MAAGSLESASTRPVDAENDLPQPRHSQRWEPPAPRPRLTTRAHPHLGHASGRPPPASRRPAPTGSRPSGRRRASPCPRRPGTVPPVVSCRTTRAPSPMGLSGDSHLRGARGHVYGVTRIQLGLIAVFVFGAGTVDRVGNEAAFAGYKKSSWSMIRDQSSARARSTASNDRLSTRASRTRSSAGFARIRKSSWYAQA